MAEKRYYNVAEAAEVLGVMPADVKKMLDDRKLYGYRDGADWKFKIEDVEKLSKEMPAQSAATPSDSSEDVGDVLMSEVELGGAEAGASGTVIGMDKLGKAAADSDIQLADDESAAAGGDVGSQVEAFEELDLTLDEDLTLEDSQIGATDDESAIDLSGGDLEDDDLVLGGSGAGSDITLGGDSGISLVDPADSGLSLEEPLELAGSGAESLELGEADMISLTEDADTDAPTELKTDDDFLLTPLEEVGDEDSESGSQVIALDTEEGGVAMAGAGGMAAMLDEEQPADLGFGEPMAGPALGAQPGALAAGAALAPAEGVLPEAPYSIWNILGLAVCTILLVLIGMFMWELLQHMWTWDEPNPAITPIMDTVLGWFE